VPHCNRHGIVEGKGSPQSPLDARLSAAAVSCLKQWRFMRENTEKTACAAVFLRF
jgi:hypothetical protein